MQTPYRIARILFALAVVTIPTAALAESVRIMAAASLTDVVEALSRDFETSHPQTGVVAVFAGSGTLARQVSFGAPADLYLSANATWVDWLLEEGHGTQAQDVASGSLVWIGGVPTGTSGRIALADPDAVPAGAYARQALRAQAAWDDLAPRFVFATNVRDTLGWVLRGHAAHGIVYATDALAYPELEASPIDPALHDPIRYRALVLGPSGQPFADYLTTPAAAAIFERFGFKPPVPEASE